MRKSQLAIGLVVLLVVMSGGAGASAADARSSEPPMPPAPMPSVQPVPGPPVANARRMRDELLAIAASHATTDTMSVWGIRAAWVRLFPVLNFSGSESPATTDTISGGDALALERGSELTTTLTFAVIDGIGTCVGGYVSGPAEAGGPIRFDRLDPVGACTAGAVYLVRNPIPEPEPEALPARKRSGKSSGTGGSSGPQTRTGHIEKRDLGSSTVSRGASTA